LNKFLNEEYLFEREKDENGDEIENGAYIKYNFSKSGKYYSPSYTSVDDYHKYIDTLPIFDEPDLFGLHENADRIYQLQESNKIQNLLLCVVPKSSQAGKSANEIVLEIVNDLLTRKPEIIEKREQRHKSHDKSYENNLPHSLTIVLYQEIEKYNKLISKISNTLEDLQKAIQGTILLSAECDEVLNSLLLNKIPISWAKTSYPSHKPLGSWFQDLILRIQFIRNWLMYGHPTCFWISGLFFPQGFITGVLQNHARETKIPVSDIKFKHTVLDKYEQDIIKPPNVGVYIYGLYLEASSWDLGKGLLVDQKPGEMSFMMPVIWLETVKENIEVKDDDNEDEDEDDENKIYYFSCNVFKTLKRTGIISASGSSNNHVISIVINLY
jgi:dynein heavy chain